MASLAEHFGPGREAVDGGNAWSRICARWRRHEHVERLAQVRMLAACWMTVSPFLERAFVSVDSVLACSGLGDALTHALALVIVHHAWQSGASKFLLARMLGNVAADFAIGAVPFLGDVLDLVFKASRRNVRLLEQHLDSQPRAAAPLIPVERRRRARPPRRR